MACPYLKKKGLILKEYHQINEMILAAGINYEY